MANELVGACWLIDFPSWPMRGVMMKICDCAEPDGSSIFPSVETICEETNTKPSSARAAIAAFEQSGLLIVKANKHGNTYGRTTVVRELDIDLLRLVTGRRVRGVKRKVKSSHVLARAEVTVPAGAMQVLVPAAAAPSLIDPPAPTERLMRVWAIVPRAAAAVLAEPMPSADDDTPPPVGGVDAAAAPPPHGGAPLQQVDPTPPRHGGVPLHHMEAAPPPGGAYPSLDPPFKKDSPLPPRRARGREKVDLLVKSIWSEQRAVAIAGLIDPLVRQRRFSAPDPAAALGVLADLAAGGLDAQGLGKVLAGLLATRKSLVKPADVQDAITAEVAAIATERRLAASPNVIRGSERYRRAIEALRKINPAEASWLSSRQVITVAELARLGVAA